MASLELNRPLIIFDLETTGISIERDRIVEICTIKVFPDGSEETKTQRYNPTIPIPLEVSKIHGIYDADVANEPTFKQKASELAAYMEGCDFGGFNSNKFDFPMLVEEFLRAGIDFDTDNRKFVDVQRIFHMMEQRNLAAALKFYCGKELTNAHSAEADTRATWEVLQAQIQRYDKIQNNIEYLHGMSGQSRNVDLAGRMVYNDKKQEVFNFGKHKGKLVSDVLRSEPSYYAWIMESDFALETKKKLTQIKIKGSNLFSR